MAITWISTKAMMGNPASQTADGSTYTQNFKVTFDVSGRVTAGVEAGRDVQLLEALAIEAQGVPRFGNQFRRNRAAFLTNKSANVLSSQSNNIPNQVIVTCTYTTISVDKKDEEENPLDKAPDITWGTHFEKEAIYNARILKVFQGNKQIFKDQKAGRGNKIQQINNFVIPITNSCGQTFSPFPEVDTPYLKCTITENLSFYDVKQAQEMIQTVNADEFRIDGYLVRQGQALLLDRSAVIQYQGKLSYRVVTTQLLFKENHELTVIDQGTKAYIKESKEFRSGDPDKRKNLMDDGAETTALENLDGRGNKLKKGKDIVFLNWGIHKVSKFKSLKLPEIRL
jgi:hypothetical protein